MEKDGFPDPLHSLGSHRVPHAVKEILRKDFLKHGLFHPESDSTRGMVDAPFQLLMEPHQVLLWLPFNPKRVVGIPLVPPTAQLLPGQILE